MKTTKKLFYYCNFLLPKKAWLLALVVLLFSSYNASAQNEKTITGTVTSAKDATPLPGVNVLVKGTKTTSVTGLDGNYSIKASSNDVLVFSYIGSSSQEVRVNNQQKINISLKENQTSLEEVVVVGYGTQKKSDLTGAVSVVNVNDAKKTITYDVAKMLQGQVPGVTSIIW